MKNGLPPPAASLVEAAQVCSIALLGLDVIILSQIDFLAVIKMYLLLAHHRHLVQVDHQALHDAVKPVVETVDNIVHLLVIGIAFRFGDDVELFLMLANVNDIVHADLAAVLLGDDRYVFFHLLSP